jgi:enamine deaminase RidA (YjgF/YER057c/UK114 family)
MVFRRPSRLAAPGGCCSARGRIALDADGKVTCAGDMRGQIEAAMSNVEAVLPAGSLSLANVVRLNFYTTDVDGLFAHYNVIASRLAAE